MSEVDEKVERLARLARERGLGGVLITRQPNFAWLTAGQTNRIDGSVDVGAGSLLVNADGHRFIVANTIEMPRLHDEALRGLSFEPVEYPWAEDHRDAAAALHAAQRRVHGNIGSDVAVPDVEDLSDAVRSLQAPLTAPEVARYRTLGHDVAAAVEQLCRMMRPGSSEMDVAVAVEDCIRQLGARAVVTLIGADDRIRRFRHPVPTTNVWRETLLVGLCAERGGLVVALSRMVSVRVSSQLRSVTEATAEVFGRLLRGTRQGATGAQLFSVATEAYAAVGHRGQESLHHQGGAIGYRSRDWIAHPSSAEVVRSPQAFAWNPSITGSKVEDTALLLDDHIDLITSTGQWPTLTTEDGAEQLSAAAILEL
jgi:Xaa-Pro aminopeptidase